MNTLAETVMIDDSDFFRQESRIARCPVGCGVNLFDGWVRIL